jgi:opacity protein-like surface antigen
MNLLKTTTAVLAVSAFLTTVGASEAKATGLFGEGAYGALRAGYGWRSSKLNAAGGTAATAYTVAGKKSRLEGMQGEVAFGYQALPELRAEFTYAYKWRKGNARTTAVYGLAPGLSSVDSLKNVKVHTHSFLVNGFYDFQVGDFTPFLTAGVGVLRGKAKSSAMRYTTTAAVAGPPAAAAVTAPYSVNSKERYRVGWNVGAGATFHVDPNLKLELMYKLSNAIKEYKAKGSNNKVKLSGALDHAVVAGIRYHF